MRGPGELYRAALDVILEEKRANRDSKEDLFGEDSAFMMKAKEYAVNRNLMKPEDELTISRPQIMNPDMSNSGEEAMMALPSPEDQNSHLLSSITATSGGYDIASPGDINAMTLEVSDDIGMGAISRAGGLPMGENMEWLKFAEDKLKRDNKLHHLQLMSELGASVLEDRANNVGTLNISLENELLQNMTDWFVAGGGELKYVLPVVSKESGFTLTALEDINTEEAVVTMPLQLTMCRLSARNVLIKKKHKYLGEELKKTFEKDESWGLALFVLHEYFKEVSGPGSKWGPYLRTLRMRHLSSPTVKALQGTRAIELMKKWLKDSKDFHFSSTGSEGPCGPTSGVCDANPNDRFSASRFEEEHMRWAYWVVQQNAIRVMHSSTGQAFLALVPFFNMVEKRIGGGGGVSFNMDGKVAINVNAVHEEGEVIGVDPGNLTDHEYYMRYVSVPKTHNPSNSVAMSLPGALPHGSEFHTCLHMSQEKKDKTGKCRKETSDLMWKMKTLAEWRKTMNLPPRVGELRMWATRLHLYGDDEEEQKRLSANNELLAGLPVSTDEIPAEEQLMLIGRAETNEEAMAIVNGGRERPPPQLYTAPDPEEDPEAQRAMEHLATLAAQVQQVVGTGNIGLNATRAVLNKTRDFFQRGVLPSGGLDELDDFLLKKIGMLQHCGTDREMKILHGNITKELMCAMRVHLMNETETNVFCPAESKVFSQNCLDVEFMNYTAISLTNELHVIDTFENTLRGLLQSYPTTHEEDERELEEKRRESESGFGPAYLGAIQLRMREKELLLKTLEFLADHKNKTLNNEVYFQLELKLRERVESNRRAEKRAAFLKAVKEKVSTSQALAIVPVELEEGAIANLTLWEGMDLRETVLQFSREHKIDSATTHQLEAKLRDQVESPPPLLLQTGIILKSGERKVLGIPENSNSSIEVGIFCMQNKIDDEEDCEKIQSRVRSLLGNDRFDRKVRATVSVDAPDSRKLQLVVREGDQHDIIQFASDFLEYYKIHSHDSVQAVANVLNQRLGAIAHQIPVSLQSQREVKVRLAKGDNITSTLRAFANYYFLGEDVLPQLFQMAKQRLPRGSYME